jgi:hypothetical protein
MAFTQWSIYREEHEGHEESRGKIKLVIQRVGSQVFHLFRQIHLLVSFTWLFCHEKYFLVRGCVSCGRGLQPSRRAGRQHAAYTEHLEEPQAAFFS